MQAADSVWPVDLAATGDDAASLGFRVETDVAALAAEWKALERVAVGSPFQRYGFYTAWLDTLGARLKAEPLLVVGRRGGALVSLVPLVTRPSGPVRVAEFAGGSHANYNLGLFDPAVWSQVPADATAALLRAIDAAERGVDLVRLTAQPLDHGGRPNPFVSARSRPAAHPSFDMTLDGGFEGVLARHRGSRKRKRIRQHVRAFDAVGGITFRRMAPGPEAAAVIDGFLDQKAVRLAEQQVPNVFAAPGTREFFHALADGDAPVFDCYGLMAGGELIATCIAAPFATSQYFVMNSFEVGRYDRLSPGDIALFHLIEDTCARGFASFDFGVGDARYKRSWLDREVPLAETLLPLSTVGAIATGTLALRRKARDFVVARPRLRAFAQRLRGGGREVPVTDGGADD